MSDDKYDIKNLLRNGQLPIDVPLIKPKPKGSGWICPSCGDEPAEGIDEKTGETVPVAIAAIVDGIKTIHCAPCVQRFFAYWQTSMIQKQVPQLQRKVDAPAD